MRLFEFNNSVGPGESEELLDPEDKIVQFVQQHCYDALEIMSDANKRLYHGFNYPTKDIFLGNPRRDRRPLETDPENQRILDRALSRAGFQALRSNSLFCTSSYDAARSYGSPPYFIFPVTGFNYSWNNQTEDLTVYYNLYGKDNSSYSDDSEQRQWTEDFLGDAEDMNPDEFVQKYGFENNTNMHTALRLHHEILIQGQYVAVSYKNKSLVDRIFSI
jgi:hypothetical protein